MNSYVAKFKAIILTSRGAEDEVFPGTMVWNRVGSYCLVWCIFVSGCTKVKKMVGLTSPDDEEVAKEAKEAGKPGAGAGGRDRGHRRQDLCEKPQPLLFDLSGGTGIRLCGKRQRVYRPGRHHGQITGKISREELKNYHGGVPPEQVQELVRQEVARIMREQGRGGNCLCPK